MIPLSPPPLTISVQLSGVLELIREDGDAKQAAFAALRKAAFVGAEFCRAVWLRTAGAMDIRGSWNDGGKITYMQGIRAGPISAVDEMMSADGFAITLQLTNIAPHAEFVETGHGAFSLPQAINWGATGGSIKRGENGPYLHIPFRHTAFASPAKQAEQGLTYGARRSMMPQDITRAAQRLTMTIRRNQGPIYRALSFRDVTVGRARAQPPDRQFVQADRYHWGGRLNRGETSPGFRVGLDGIAFQEHRGARTVGRGPGGTVLVNPAWQSSKYHGLFKTGPKGHTAYRTIRTITPHSLGWNIPAMTGRYVARQVAHELTYGETAAELARIVSEPFMAALLTGGS